MGSEQFSLKWNNYQSNLVNMFEEHLLNEKFVDVTLACEGDSLKAHKVVLSACSPYFQTLLSQNPCKHPIVFMKDVKYEDLKVLVDYMYRGEVNVTQNRLSSILKTAEMLNVKGLGRVQNMTEAEVQDTNLQQSSTYPTIPSLPSTVEREQPQSESQPSLRQSRPMKRFRSESAVTSAPMDNVGPRRSRRSRADLSVTKANSTFNENISVAEVPDSHDTPPPSSTFEQSSQLCSPLNPATTQESGFPDTPASQTDGHSNSVPISEEESRTKESDNLTSVEETTIPEISTVDNVDFAVPGPSGHQAKSKVTKEKDKSI